MHPSSAEALAVVEIGTVLHAPIDRWWSPTEVSRLGGIGLIIVRSVEVRSCFSPTPPLPEGETSVRFTAEFTVDATGVASGFSLVEFPGSPIEACLATTFGRLRYPPGAGPVSVRWPMVLTPPRG